MSEQQTPQSSHLEETLKTLSFIHQKLTTVQYYPEEFKQADVALRMVIEMAQRVSKDLHESSQPVDPQPVKKQRKSRKTEVANV